MNKNTVVGICSLIVFLVLVSCFLYGLGQKNISGSMWEEPIREVRVLSGQEQDPNGTSISYDTWDKEGRSVGYVSIRCNEITQSLMDKIEKDVFESEFPSCNLVGKGSNVTALINNRNYVSVHDCQVQSSNRFSDEQIAKMKMGDCFALDFVDCWDVYLIKYNIETN